MKDTNNTNWLDSLKPAKGQWKALEELATDSESADAVRSEFLKKLPSSLLSRRDFMGWMAGLSAVLTTSCTRQPPEHILPYTQDPEGMVLGKPLFFATAHPHSRGALGVLVESHEGRPTKVEGNPDHPASLGGTDAITQASVLELYDPDRLTKPYFNRVVSSYPVLQDNLQARVQRLAQTQGAGIRILTESITSPTLASQLRAFFRAYPGARWVKHEGVSYDSEQEGTRLAFGKALSARYEFGKANVVLALDADFTDGGPGGVRFARDFTSRRRTEGGLGNFNRLYSLECTPTPTGTLADHRFPVEPDRLYAVALEVARNVGVAGIPAVNLSDAWKRLAELIAADLKQNRGASAVVPGEFQDAQLHALAHAMNDALGNIGQTVHFQEPIAEEPAEPMTLRELTDEMKGGDVEMLIILGGDPVYTAPPELNFGEALKGLPFTLHHTLYSNDTSEHVKWVVPRTHYLEAWSDVRAYDGTVTILQPLIRPLHGALSDHELVARLSGNANPDPLRIVKDQWMPRLKTDKAWRKAVHDGVVPDTARPAQRVRLAARRFPAPFTAAADGVTVILRPDPCIYDGRHANNGWLQELPKPITKVTWENVIQISATLAGKRGLRNGQVATVAVGERKVSGPVWIVPGQPENTLTIHLGYGRKTVGRVGAGYGFSGYALRSVDQNWAFYGATLTPTGQRVEVATTQQHQSMEGRDLVKHATLQEFEEHPNVFHHQHFPDPNVVQPQADVDGPPFSDPHYAWGMAIDLSACNGCSACVTACDVENNIPFVGKKEVLIGREMHWLLVDRYYEGAPDNPETHMQPRPCMHCEKAPCEVVCPVAATTHSSSGLNEMTYNRCVGTKYCGNNCPYKVRRFNFYQYAEMDVPLLQLARNPDVTVRSRGVMEKCTYCVQRINVARIEAKKENRIVRDGEVKTACQEACPTRAIVFGNIKDPNSEVSRWKAHENDYGLLAELGTRPRTTYLAKLRNPNPAVVAYLKNRTL